MEAASEIGFTVGWDHARHGVQLMGRVPPIVIEGFRAFLASEKKRVYNVDRYTRKWLLLRLNAFKRWKAFDPGVTPEYLAKIDVPYCPILRIPLTHGTREDTDWSVDRLINSGCYAPGNLIVMSARANKIKSDLEEMDLRGVDRFKSPLGELDDREWARLITLITMQRAWENGPPDEDMLAPVVEPSSCLYLSDTVFALHSLMRRIAASGDDITPYLAACVGNGKKQRKEMEAAFHALIAQVVHVRKSVLAVPMGDELLGYMFRWNLEDHWYESKVAFEKYRRFIRTFRDRQHVNEFSITLLRAFSGEGRSLSRTDTHALWHLDTQGRMEPELA